jgi:hypothetical protein
LVVALLGFGTAQAEVSRWVDEKGVVHYGDVVPEKYRGRANAVPLRSDALSPEQEKEAQLRMQKYREALKPAARAPEPAPPAIVDSTDSADSPALPIQTTGLTCDEQWQQYFAAQDCFGPYRIKNGAAKIEAFSHCPVISVPNCVARYAKPR